MYKDSWLKYERKEMEQAFRELVKNEKPTLAVMGALVGMVPATLVVALMSEYFILGLVAASIGFPAIAGYFARYVGRLYSPSSSIPTAIFVGVAYVTIGAIFQAQGVWYFVSPIPFGVAFFVSQVPLTELQEFAIAEHDVRPFEVQTQPALKKIGVPLLILFTPFVATYIFIQPNGGCLTSIENDEYDEIANKCSYSSAQAFIVEGGNVGHKFGTYYEPTAEAKLLRKKAEEGDEHYQIIWWLIYDRMYRRDISVYGANRIEQFEQEAKRLRHRAAELGHAPAVQREYEIYTDLGMKLRTEREKQESIAYAKKLVALEIDGAKALLDKVNKIVIKEDIVDFYHTQQEELDTLSFDDLDNLLFAVEEGEYYYNLRDFNDRAFDTGSYSVSVEVPANESKVIDILRVMSEKYADRDASIRVFNLLKDEDYNEALYFLEKAATQGHAEAAARLGKNLFCDGKKLDGLIWIKKAADLGYEKAANLRNEIARTNSLETCD